MRPASGPSRPDPRALLVIAALLLIARVGLGVRESRTPPEALERVRWRPIPGAVDEARRAGRPLLYDFTAAWCPPCRRMQHEIFADERGAGVLNSQFVPVRVLDRTREEGTNTPEVDALQRRFHVSVFPTLVVTAPDGGEPVTIEGYPGREAVMRGLVSAAMAVRMQAHRHAIPFPSADTGGR